MKRLQQLPGFHAVFTLMLAWGIVLTAKAQTDDSIGLIKQGDWQAGGSFSWTDPEKGDATFILDPRAMYFFWDHVAVGGRVNFTYTNDATAYGLGPALAWYFWNRDAHSLYVSETLAFNWVDVDQGEDVDTINSITSVGYKYFVNPNVAIGPEISYSQGINSEDEEEDSDSAFDVLAAFSFHF